jgi:glycosyltransferase involved in cell wall biosynthesis
LKILFLNKKRKPPKEFDFSRIDRLRGVERTTLLLAEAMSARGHEVTVAALTRGASEICNGVELTDVQAAKARAFDVAVSNNLASAFDGIRARAKVLWVRNPGFSWTHIRMDYLAKLRHWPHVVHMSDYTLRRSWFLPHASQTVIRHGVPTDLLEARSLRTEAPEPIAVFSSVASRNLSLVLRAWRDVVHPKVPTARLLVTTNVEPHHLEGIVPNALPALNVEIKGSIAWPDLMDLFRKARVLLVPGHFQETFNSLSIEGAACGIPTVTMGIGALRERVIHDRTGWIAASETELGDATARLLTDDAQWMDYHRACLDHPDLVRWDARAAEWEAFLSRVIGTAPGAR